MNGVTNLQEQTRGSLNATEDARDGAPEHADLQTPHKASFSLFFWLFCF